MSLTDEAAKRAATKDRPYYLTDGHGMSLLVMPNGAKWWRFKYRFAGKSNRLSLGVYPSVSLAEAREECRHLHQVLAGGGNPSETRKTARQAWRDDQARLSADMRFAVDDTGSLAIRLGSRRITLTPSETASLRVFLDSTRSVATQGDASCP